MSISTSVERYTYDDLQRFPDDHFRREIIDGELFVTGAPVTRHQHAVASITADLVVYARVHGGQAFPAPTDVYFSESTVVQPDVVYVTAANMARVEAAYIRSAPDIVVEVSSPSTRRLDLVKKRALFEREGVPEFWFVDLDADQVDVYRLGDGRYGMPTTLGRGAMLTTPLAPGLAIDVDEVLGEASEAS